MKTHNKWVIVLLIIVGAINIWHFGGDLLHGQVNNDAKTTQTTKKANQKKHSMPNLLQRKKQPMRTPQKLILLTIKTKSSTMLSKITLRTKRIRLKVTGI
jgi:hypothetical protein